MTDEERMEIKGAVQEGLRELLAELRPLPVPAYPLHVGAFAVSSCPLTPVPISLESKKLLKQIKDVIGEEQEEVIEKLELRIRGRLLDEEILKYAEEVGIQSE